MVQGSRREGEGKTPGRDALQKTVLTAVVSGVNGLVSGTIELTINCVRTKEASSREALKLERGGLCAAGEKASKTGEMTN